jgi:K+-sensing histidine kinase KdpD
MVSTTVGAQYMRKAAVVVVAVVLATLLTFPIAARMFNSRDLLFVAAVILVSRFEGSIAGICTAVLSVLAFNWYFDMTPGNFDITFGNGVRMLVFISLSAMVALLDRQRRTAMDSLVRANQKLHTALEEIKTLRGILLICSYCKKIETNPETWVDLENYVRKHSDAEFSHGVCPNCLRSVSQKQMARVK